MFPSVPLDGTPQFQSNFWEPGTMAVLSPSPLQDSRFSAVFFNAATAIAVLDLNGLLVDVNPAFCKISGYTLEELTGSGFGAFGDDEEHRFASLVAGEIPGYTIVRRYARKDGGTVWTRNSVSLLHDEAGNPVGAMAVLEDWTERKVLEEAARQTHKMEALGRLAGGVAHDFNNMLMIINSYASLLKEDFGEHTPAGGRAMPSRRPARALPCSPGSCWPLAASRCCRRKWWQSTNWCAPANRCCAG